jgi:hypothetical protein
MPLILPGNVASATAAAGYSIDNSCRFNGSDEYMQKTSSAASPTLATKATFSIWIKRCQFADSQFISYTAGAVSPYWQFRFGDTNDNLWMQDYDGADSYYVISTPKYGDPGAWYHLCYSYDSTPATPSASSIRIFINGTQVTEFGTATYPSQNRATSMTKASQTFPIGASVSGANTYSGYLAEVVCVDGQALLPTSFGQFNADSPTIWEPIDVTGLTLGNQGFYLDFKDSANLGNDANGGVDFTETNIDATNQCTDTPTNNFCVINPLDNYYAASTFSEGNCKIVTNSSNRTWNTGTIGLTAGKWYWEVKATEMSSDYQLFGISDIVSTSTTRQLGQDTYSYALNGDNGTIYSNSSSSGADWEEIAQGDIIGHYLDLDNNKMYWAKDGSIMNSGTGFSITAAASTGTGFYLPAFGEYAASDTLTAEANFGGSPAFTVSSAVADANGYGNFEYDPSDGGNASFDGSAKDFLAICTKNLGSDGG